MTINEYENRYENIMDSNLITDKKNSQLASLMTQMEAEFKIPVLNDEKWNAGHKEVIELYKRISNSRIF